MKENKVPDFDDLLTIATKVSTLKKEALVTSITLDVLVADIIRKVSTDEKYFINGKTPSMTYINSTYVKIGYDKSTRDKLLELKQKLAEVESDLRLNELLFNVYRSQIDIWRTESANKRNTFYDNT